MDFGYFEGVFWAKNGIFCMKIFFSNIEQTTLFLLGKNVFWVTFLKKQHCGTPEMTRTQEFASEAHMGKSRFWALQSDLGVKI